MAEKIESNNVITPDLQKSIDGIQEFFKSDLIGEIQGALATISEKKDFSPEDLENLSKVYENIQASAEKMGVADLFNNQGVEKIQSVEKDLEELKSLIKKLYSFNKSEFEKIHANITELKQKVGNK